MSTVRLTIDGQGVEVEAGQSVLQAARKLRLDIPTLCFLEHCGPATSCLVCLVKVRTNGHSKLVPSCATQAEPGMIIESETAEVHEARRTALELLLSDHVGDCLSPCQRICPLHLDIPVMLRQIRNGHLEQAAHTVKAALPLPAVLGRLCHHPCENGCRRASCDQPAAIRDLERSIADTDLNADQPFLPQREPRSGKSVVVIGSGPTGLAAAWWLVRHGHACTVVDRHSAAGGSLRGCIDANTLPAATLDAEIHQLQRLGVQLKLGVEFGTVVTLDGLQRGFDAILLTVGAIHDNEAAQFGVALSASGIQVDALSRQTTVPNVFAAGNAVRPVKQLVRAMAEGCAAAESIDCFLSGRPFREAAKSFSSMMGRLERSELDLFLKSANPAPRGAVSCHGCSASPPPDPGEAARCLHCDCRARDHCKLQHYAETYGAEPNRFREARRPFAQEIQPGDVIYEPGKCILCGICVQITERAREPLGLTFVGRGFDVRVSAPFGRTISEGLQRVAAECVEACPTGALVFRERYESTQGKENRTAQRAAPEDDA